MKDLHVPVISVIDDLSPEDAAMLQALYSRSAESSSVHLEKVRKSGSGKFMSSFYVGYGHKSIADCGSTTVFIENVSLLAAKAIQDWPLYSGQETSTRYIDMARRDLVDPAESDLSNTILNEWMTFYTANQGRVAQVVRDRHPIAPGESPDTYAKAVKARTFDILRGFLPAGITTQLSWHTNLRQAGDHLNWLKNHPSPEISVLARSISGMLHEKYPSSGFASHVAGVSGVGSSSNEQERAAWELEVARAYSYQPAVYPWRFKDETVLFAMTGAIKDLVSEHRPIIKCRPRGSVLPHFMSSFGQCHWTFLLDFGSFRDIQRHRNGVCRMPILTTDYGFEPWYLEQLDEKLLDEARTLIDLQEARIAAVDDDPVIRQYYTALGYRVTTDVTYALPAAVYVLELRSGKHVHPSLRKKVHLMVESFRARLPDVLLHVDEDPSDWDIRRGTQTITAK